MDKVNYVLKHPHLLAYLSYCFSYIGYGMLVTSLGPYIPYIAEDENRHETSYSFIFLCRAIGTILGSFLSKIWQKYFSFHRIIAFSLITFSLGSVSFGLATSDFSRGLSMLIACIGSSQLNVFEHLCIIETFKHDNLDAWLQINHGMFGVGGLIGPFLVFLLEKNTFLCLGLIGLLCAPPFFFLISPDS